jgi:hypothetical protein
VAGVQTSFGLTVLASGVPLGLFLTLEVLVALSATPPGLLNHLGSSVGVVTIGPAKEGAYRLNHFLLALASA